MMYLNAMLNGFVIALKFYSQDINSDSKLYTTLPERPDGFFPFSK